MRSNNPSRRKFLQSAITAGATAAAYPALGAAREITTAKPVTPEVKPFELDEITIPELQEGMKSGKFTARALVEKYSTRIDEIDKRGPAVNAVIELNPEAAAIAEALDQERKGKGPRGPLHGIPVLIKDNIDTADRMMTTAGSLALIGSKTAEGFVRGAETARRRSSHSRQDESQRVGQHPFQPLDQRMERARRPHEESLRARPQCLRVEFRDWRWYLCKSRRSWHRHGDRRLDRLPVVLERPRWNQAHGGTGEPDGHHSHLA